MKRKVIKQGPSTLMVSLPSKWVKNKDIRRGDEINIFEQGEDIILTLEKKEQLKKIKSNIDKLPAEQLGNYLSTLYSNGYDEIELIGKIPMKEVTNAINKVVGLEVVEAEENRILIKSYLKENEEDINKIIKKLFQLIKSFIKEIEKENYDPKWYVNLTNKTALHCMRLIRKTEHKNKKYMDQFSFIRSISRLSSSIYWFCEAMKTNKLPKTNLIKDILSLVEMLEKGYQKNNFNESNKIWANFVKHKQKVNSKNINKLLKKENPLIVVHYYAILRDFSNSFVYLRDITLPAGEESTI